MTIEKLKTDFRDDILNTSISDKRQYNLIQNSNGTTSLEDVSTYDQIGDNYGSAEINKLNGTVNELIDAYKGIGFVLRNQALLVFSGNICSILDSRITADSLADVYFTEDTINNATKAAISVETYNGKVDLTAGRTPQGDIKASIIIKVVA